MSNLLTVLNAQADAASREREVLRILEARRLSAAQATAPAVRTGRITALVLRLRHRPAVAS